MSKANATPGGGLMPAMKLGENGRTVRGNGAGRAIGGLTWVQGSENRESLDEVSGKNLAAQPQSGTSIFDPVLCELAYRWFCPEGGSVLDPFAGGSVRGIVASTLGRDYTGIDLSERQIVANREQAQRICTQNAPKWVLGDSRNVTELAPGEYDLLFSCPPYGDLEVYSDDPLDLSTLDYGKFIEAYRAIIAASVAMLRDNRFACFVVGDIRDKKGIYRGFVGDTVQAFIDAGMKFYNDAVLVTVCGSLPIRAGKQFTSGRKLGKTHQNVQVFVKGDPKNATEACGDIDIDESLFSEESPDTGYEPDGVTET